MSSKPISMLPVRVCIVQPVQSPYWTERLKILANDKNIELTLLLERDSFSHRPGWQSSPIKGVSIQVLGSLVTNTVRKGDDLGYRIQGIRSIPWRLMIELLRRKPNVIVLCNATQIIFTLPLKYFFRKKLVLLVEDTPHATRNLSYISKWVKCLLYRRADKYFAFSADAKSFLENLGIEKGVERTSWSLDMNTFRPNPKKAKCNQGNAESHKSVIFIGAFIQSKGVKQLLEAWRAIASQVRSKSELLLVGSGPMRQELEDFIQKHALHEVKVLGQVPYLKVSGLLQQSDLFVLPTLQDLFSLTVLEAMACGCPVVTTPLNGARDLVDEGINGWVVDPTQSGVLTAVLERALSDQVDLSSMGHAARLRVERMDNNLVMTEFAQSLRNLVASKDR